MKKMRLVPESLRVESFAIAAENAPAQAAFTGKPTCWLIYTCPECATPPTV